MACRAHLGGDLREAHGGRYPVGAGAHNPAGRLRPSEELVVETHRERVPGFVLARLLRTAAKHGRVGAIVSVFAAHEQALPEGEGLCAVAVLEEGNEPGGGAPSLEREWLRGRALFVADAHVATHLIVIGGGKGRLHAALLPIDRQGLRAIPLDSMAGDRLFEIDLEDVEVRAEDRLGPLGVDSVLASPAFVLGALAPAADMTGAAQRVLDLCVEHARTRTQFGRPIGSFQAIQHACADLLRDVETSRWLSYEAAWRLEHGDGAALVAGAKAYGGEACLRVARRAHQIMGSIGYCEEHLLHLFHKRILAGSLAWGEPAQHLETVARAIGLD